MSPPVRGIDHALEALAEDADRLVARYPHARSALLPLLHLVQSVEGHVSDAGIRFCADRLGLTLAEVGAVASFYTMFKRRPVGDWLLSVCTNPVCKIAGGGEIYARYLEALGGHHDADAGMTVEHAECLGICDRAPVVQVNYEVFGPLTPDEADDLLERCRRGEPPPSGHSGEVPSPFRAVERELSGIDDGARLAEGARISAEVAVHAPVPPADISGETDLPVTMPGVDERGLGGAVRREQAGGDAGFPEEPEAPAAGDADVPESGQVPAEATAAGRSPTGAPTGATNLPADQTGVDDLDRGRHDLPAGTPEGGDDEDDDDPDGRGGGA